MESVANVRKRFIFGPLMVVRGIEVPSTTHRRFKGLQETHGVRSNLNGPGQELFLLDLDARRRSLEGSFIKAMAEYETNDWPHEKGKRNRLKPGTTAVQEAELRFERTQEREAATRRCAFATQLQLPQQVLAKSVKPDPVLRGTLSPSRPFSRRRVSK
jgi:hypothetical protein